VLAVVDAAAGAAGFATAGLGAPVDEGVAVVFAAAEVVVFAAAGVVFAPVVVVFAEAATAG